MWRPDNWEKERDQWLNTVGGEFADSGEVMEASVIYEAGADAMLEALKKKGYYIMPATYIDYSPLIAHLKCRNKHGWLVSIPDDQHAFSKK